MLPDEIVKRFRVKNGRKFELSEFDPRDTAGLDMEKEDAKTMLAGGVKRLRALQEKLYAEARWSVLVIFQAMDAAGKDSAVEHVMSGVNPQGCQVTSFKTPSLVELRHDFLWRAVHALPERGRIGIFNRSYYEEALVVRVHEELLAKQNLPKELSGSDIWDGRYQSIRDFEDHLARNGTVVLKFFLHVSKDEQRRRFLDRIEQPEKRWKFEMGDIAERRHWDDYMAAYHDMISATATKASPWHVVPADNKWFTRLVVAAALVDRLEKLDPQFPTVSDEAMKGLEQAKADLLAETSGKSSSKK